MKRILLILLICILAAGGVMAAYRSYTAQNREETPKPEAEEPPEPEPEPAEEEPEPEPEYVREIDYSLRKKNNVDFESLWERNEDIFAWLEVPGTLVDYPVLQHPDDALYYLEHTVDKKAGLPGSIYSEPIHPKDMSAACTIFYGHNMKNDSMFGSLHEYDDEEFFEGHPYVYLYLPDRTLLYQIFAAVEFTDDYLPEYCDFEDEEERTAFIEEIKKRPGCVNEDVELFPTDRFLIMSTCIGGKKMNRFLVMSVLIDEYEDRYVLFEDDGAS